MFIMIWWCDDVHHHLTVKLAPACCRMSKWQHGSTTTKLTPDTDIHITCSLMWLQGLLYFRNNISQLCRASWTPLQVMLLSVVSGKWWVVSGERWVVSVHADQGHSLSCQLATPRLTQCADFTQRRGRTMHCTECWFIALPCGYRLFSILWCARVVCSQLSFLVMDYESMQALLGTLIYLSLMKKWKTTLFLPW